MIRFGIAGTGRISDWVLKGAVQDSRFKATAVCSRNIENARAFIERHPEAFSKDARAFDSIEEMASWEGIDAVYVGTPTSTHFAYTQASLERGKHVLCEKPMGCTAEQVRKMATLAREKKLLLMEAMISTLNPNFRTVKERMEELTGTTRHFSSSFCQYSSKYEALRKGIVSNSFNPLMGGGALNDIGIYTVYPAVALFGRPESVKANIVSFPTEFGETDVAGTILLGYPGMTAALAYSKVVDSFQATEICGEKGNLILDAIHICRRLEYAGHQVPNSGRGPVAGRQTLSEGLEKDEYFYEFEEFINVLDEGRTESELNSLEISIVSREIMDEAICGR